MRASRPASQPATFQKSKRPDADAAKTRKASPPPRSWVITVPSRPYRTPRDRSADEPYAAASTHSESDSAAPFAAATAPEEGPAAAPAAVAPEPPASVRVVVLNADPPRRQPAAGPKLPHHFAICYWNQAGRCIEQ
jgi:hypothetical protein